MGLESGGGTSDFTENGMHYFCRSTFIQCNRNESFKCLYAVRYGLTSFKNRLTVKLELQQQTLLNVMECLSCEAKKRGFLFVCLFSGRL
jgi:hypothetical protein